MQKPLIRFLLPIPFLASCLVAEAKVYFQEDFSQYTEKIPRINPTQEVRLGNEPIWNQENDATILAKTNGLLWTEFRPEALPSNLTEYDVKFSFRFHSDNRQVRAVIRMEQDGKLLDAGVNISSNRVAVSIPGRENVEAALDADLPRGLWMECVVKVSEGALRVWLAENRVFNQVLEMNAPKHSFAGLNFEITEGAPFALTDVVVCDPAPLPDYGVARFMPEKRRQVAALQSGGRHEVRDGAVLRVGEGLNTAALELNWADDSQTRVTFGTTHSREKRREIKDGKVVMVDADMSNALIRVTGLQERPKSFDVFVRPMLRVYTAGGRFKNEYHDFVREWDSLPPASEHPLRVEAKRTESGTEIWLDGSIAASFEGKSLKSMVFDLTDAASVAELTSQNQNFDAARFLPLDIAALGMAKAFADAKPSLKTGLQNVKNIPMIVADGAGSGDVGLAKMGQGTWALEVDEYTRRWPFDGFPSELHFLVPGGVPYSRAWLLLALDPDPAKDPILTTRIAGYMRGGYLNEGAGNNRITDTTINLPRVGEKPGAGVVQVGTVGNVPLFLVEVPLNGGEILDIMMSEPRLNFEFMGKPWENFQQLDNTKKPDPRSTSAVQIFGVTLEKSSVALAMEQSQPGNVFHNDEKPETTAVLTARGKTSVKLVWDVTDATGARVGGGSEKFKFAKAGEERRVVIPLETKEPGWFGLNVRMENENGRVEIEHPAAFARLGEDTRKAHFDSPFGIWWFAGTHATPDDVDFCGSIMEKAGIRKITRTAHKLEDLERYKLFADQVNMPFRFGDFGATPEDLAAEAANPGEKTEQVYAAKKEQFDKLLERHPHAREVLIFHESGPGNDVPPEVLGLPYVRPVGKLRDEKRYADTANLAGAFFRKYYPQLKTVVGNGNCSASNIAAILRHGGKEEFIDFIGNESAAQSIIPEKLQEYGIQGHHIAMDTAETLAGRRIPATGCYEFTYRAERNTGELRQAEWYVRDVLIGLAHNYTRVGPGILIDVQNAYYNTLWGGSGLLRRGPTAYPKPAYVAYAVLTEALDQVKFSRRIPTGSTTVYAVEFKRADGRYATALWAARGDAEFVLNYGDAAEIDEVSMFGARENRKAKDGEFTVKAGTSPKYVLSAKPVESVSIVKRAFPDDERREEASKVVAKFTDAAALKVVSDDNLDTPLDQGLQLAIRKAGDFKVTTVRDDDEGRCVELALQTERTPELDKYFTEYAVLKLKEPVEVQGRPVGFGATIKGNSNWGRVIYVIKDANGETWRSVSTGGWSVDILDWPGNAAVNFDGWNMVATPMAETSLFGERSPGSVLEQWASDGGGDKIVDFPVKLTGLIVEMNRQPLELTEFTAVEPSILIKDVRALYEP